MGRTVAPVWTTGWRGLAWAALAVAAYVGAAAWAHQFAVTPTKDLTIWYPGPGILLGLLVEVRRWTMAVALAVGELLASVLVFGVGDEFGGPRLVINAAAIAGAYTLSAIVVVRWRRGGGPLARVPDLLALVVGGAGVGSLGAALLGTAMQRWADLATGTSFWEGVRLWWVSDAIGVLALAPAVMLLVPRGAAREPRRPIDAISVGLAAAVLVGPSVVLWLGGDRPFRFVYLVFLPVVIVAVRHGIAGAVLAVAVTHVMLTMEVDRLGGGTVGRDDLQLLLLVASVAGMVIGLLATEQRAGERRLVELGDIIEATSDLVATIGADGSFRYLNRAGRELLGLRPDGQVVGLPASLFLADELAQAAADVHAVDPGASGDSKVERVDGQTVAVSYVLVRHRGADGEPVVSAVVRDITPQRRIEDELGRRALHDDQTGLANRALFVAEVRRACARADRSAARVGLLHLDLDGFKGVNDALGSDAGDTVLRTIARRLRIAVNEADLLARLGADEFCVLLDDLDELAGTGPSDVPSDGAERAVALAERLRVLAQQPIVVDGTVVTLSASVGVAFATAASTDPRALQRHAESAMRRAKRDGGGRVVVFDPHAGEPADARRELAAVLADGIRSGEWTLAYQPIVDTRSRRIVGAEALFRWSHPDFGPLPAGEVIEIAEETGLIVPLGLDILRRACADAVAWPDAALRLNVNVSAVQLLEADLARHIADVLDATGLAPTRLVLEVTETALVVDLPAAAASLRELRSRGVAVALDDFGTGYSSLASLRELPIDEIKLDRTFVTGLGGAVADEILVASVLTMARGLGLTVVAEGVEEQRQLERLVAYGCDRVQGYLLARPMAAEAWSALLRSCAPGFVLDRG